MNRKSPLKQKKPLWKYCAEKKAKERAKLTKETPMPQVGVKTVTALKKPPGAILVRKSKLRKQSVKRSHEMTLYYKERKAWLLLPQNAACAICLCLGVTPMAATEVHHKNGRIGRLLRYQPWWIPSCRACRSVPHDRPDWARDTGLIGAKNEWNVYPE